MHERIELLERGERIFIDKFAVRNLLLFGSREQMI
jgi:hypothetical protein